MGSTWTDTPAHASAPGTGTGLGPHQSTASSWRTMRGLGSDAYPYPTGPRFAHMHAYTIFLPCKVTSSRHVSASCCRWSFRGCCSNMHSMHAGPGGLTTMATNTVPSSQLSPPDENSTPDDIKAWVEEQLDRLSNTPILGRFVSLGPSERRRGGAPLSDLHRNDKCFLIVHTQTCTPSHVYLADKYSIKFPVKG